VVRHLQGEAPLTGDRKLEVPAGQEGARERHAKGARWEGGGRWE
jgi:hypothetical protein